MCVACVAGKHCGVAVGGKRLFRRVLSVLRFHIVAYGVLKASSGLACVALSDSFECRDFVLRACCGYIRKAAVF